MLLARGVAVNARNENGENIMMETVRSDSIEAVQLLLEAGADVKAVADDGETVRAK